MSLKAHIALGTLLGLLLGAGAVAVLSHTAAASESPVGERDRAADEQDDGDVSPAAAVSQDFRRPMRPGSHRRLLQT